MKFGKKTIALIGAVAMLSSVAACGSTSAGDGGSTGSSDKKVELTVWSWDSTLPRTVKGFEAKNPNIKVKVTNAGTNKDEYKHCPTPSRQAPVLRTSPRSNTTHCPNT